MKLENIDQYVGKQLSSRRRQLNLSQRNLAEKADITLRQLQKYEEGLNRIGASRLYVFAHILDVGIAYFFDGYFDEYDQSLPSSPDRKIINELIPVFLKLNSQTQENILKLLKDLSSEDQEVQEKNTVKLLTNVNNV